MTRTTPLEGPPRALWAITALALAFAACKSKPEPKPEPGFGSAFGGDGSFSPPPESPFRGPQVMPGFDHLAPSELEYCACVLWCEVDGPAIATIDLRQCMDPPEHCESRALFCAKTEEP